MMDKNGGMLTVAAVQTRIRPVSSFGEFAKDVRQSLDAAGSDTGLIVLPQLFTMGLFAIEQNWQHQDPTQLDRISGFLPQILTLFAAEAKQRRAWILAGSTLEQEEVGKTNDGVTNRAYLFGPQGQRSAHTKTRMFPMEKSWGTRAGDSLNVVDIGVAHVGIAICYESTIPEVTTALSRQGAEIILVPAYNHSAHAFCRSRLCAATNAIQNQVYVVHCPAGGELPGIFPPGQGGPSILSPIDEGFPHDGILAEGAPAPDDTGDVLVARATLDLGRLRKGRRKDATTIFNDRLGATAQ